MARGDAFTDVVRINASSTVNVQPSSGVECRINSMIGDYQSVVRAWIADGTDLSIGFSGADLKITCGVCSLVITNTNYLQFQNSHASQYYTAAYGGYITKD